LNLVPDLSTRIAHQCQDIPVSTQGLVAKGFSAG
jgi:hypothetical protein